MKEPPLRSGEFRLCALDPAAYLLAAMWRMGVRASALRRFIFLAMRPIAWIERMSIRMRCKPDGYAYVCKGSFGDSRFNEFWERFLAGNDGVISSREPRRLQWLFDDSIKAGKVFLSTAEKGGRIEGYVLVREKGMGKWPKCYDIIDICAIGNNIGCLKGLCLEARRIATEQGGAKLYFSGSMPNQEKWLDPVFRHHGKEDCYFMFGTGNKEIKESLEKNEGWFFGPFDGERCLGHGGYIDL